MITEGGGTDVPAGLTVAGVHKQRNVVASRNSKETFSP